MEVRHPVVDSAALNRHVERVEKGTRPQRSCQRVLALSIGRFSGRTAMMKRTIVLSPRM